MNRKITPQAHAGSGNVFSEHRLNAVWVGQRSKMYTTWEVGWPGDPKAMSRQRPHFFALSLISTRRVRPRLAHPHGEQSLEYDEGQIEEQHCNLRCQK
jgi:hypothetical protein